MGLQWLSRQQLIDRFTEVESRDTDVQSAAGPREVTEAATYDAYHPRDEYCRHVTREEKTTAKGIASENVSIDVTFSLLPFPGRHKYADDR